jgi:Carboxypeptidase regulatory-like domain
VHGRRLKSGAVIWLCVVLHVPTAAEHVHVAATAATGEINGTVMDESGQRLPGVLVVAVPQRGGVAVRTTTDPVGAYRVGGLSDEPYRIDFWLAGFQGTRLNHVQAGFETRTHIDAVLLVRPLCECIRSGPVPPARRIAGRVLDGSGRPLPHALLEFAGPARRERAWADEEGRFVVSPPPDGSWSVIASDSGFESVSQSVSAWTMGPLALRLRFVGDQELPKTEWFNRGCACPEYLFLVDR